MACPTSSLQAQPSFTSNAALPCFLQKETPWADSLVKTLTLDEKIGQLFMVAAWSDPKHNDYDPKGVELLIDKYHIGGLIFMQGSPVRQAQLTNRFQNKSGIPLLIAMDAEWGLGMRLDSTISFPRGMTLGAMGDENLVYEFGFELGRQCKRLGVHVNFAPVVDVNNNPQNPVISNRAFGEDKELVTQRGLLYMQGLQNSGVIAVAKHFPGHGDTDTDSHYDLPVIQHDIKRLEEVELYPYSKLFSKGLGGVMTAHLYIPSLDNTPNLASTLSPKIVNDLLQRKMNFSGLVFTDALNMQGVAKYFDSGEVDLNALLAGNDVLLFPQNIPLAVEKIKAAIDSGLISEQEITQHCIKILRAKEWCGLSRFTPIETKNLVQDLNTAEAEVLRRKMIEQSITVLNNGCSLVPISGHAGKRIAVVSIGTTTANAFEETLSGYFPFDAFSMDKNPDFKSAIKWHDTLSTYDLVIAAMLNTSNKASKNFGISNEAARILNAVGANTDIILSVFANPYSFNVLKDLDNTEGIIIAYQDDALTQQVCAEVIAGGTPSCGALPVSASNRFRFGDGISLHDQTRLRWVTPEYVGLKSAANLGVKDSGYGAASLNDHPEENEKTYQEDMMSDNETGQLASEISLWKIDSIAQSGIRLGAYPGCRVLAAKDGKVFYDKAFGMLDYTSREPVTSATVYDLASITKIASSTLCAMKMVDDSLLDVNKTLGDYLEIPAGNDYRNITIKAMMSHCAGLTPWIPFWQKTVNDGGLRKNLYHTISDSLYNNEVAEGIYMLSSYRDSIFSQIISTPLSADKSYKYSDLGYYFLQRIIEKQTGMTEDEYVLHNFYEPMGLQSIGYEPLRRMEKKVIAPTENDQAFRKQKLQGHVHDQGAAMMGGVAGHAGVFSNAQDLAALMQMMMDGGEYGGQRFLSKETIDLFNSIHFSGNRRGIGFDKPTRSINSGPTSNEVSMNSFGHTGFTGTMCWADPDAGIVYVFLSNRVHPDAENKKLQDLNIRTEIQEAVYEAFGIPDRK